VANTAFLLVVNLVLFVLGFFLDFRLVISSSCRWWFRPPMR
jgi:TRAP-type mannitol/chloroaromatic compound transport system permease large subunit